MSLIIGFILDLIFGDPDGIPHPIRGMGKTIAASERMIRRWSGDNRKKQLIGGILLVICNLTAWGLFSFGICTFAYRLNPYVGIGVESFLCFQLLAAKGLKQESMKVYQALKGGTVEEARTAVSRIVGRDTQNLTAEGVTKAAVETVAENLADGVIAPLFYMAIGGAFGGYLYKVINTMDSMIGYKDEKYLYIGRAAAKLDDICNYIPARLSAVLMILACPFCGLDLANAWHIWRRDRRNHSSPNSAQTEAAAAGALHIQLAGEAWYFGKRYEKQTIGDANRAIEIDDIIKINRLMYISSTAAVAIFVLLSGKI